MLSAHPFFCLKKMSDGWCLLQHSEISHSDGNVNVLKGWCYFYISLFESSVSFFFPSNLVVEANTALILK